jgi:SAM-dependent methyltransferase
MQRTLWRHHLLDIAGRSWLHYGILKYNVGNAKRMSAKLPASSDVSMSSRRMAPFEYRGHDILDLLKRAKNYNRWLTDQVLAAKPPGARKIIDLGAGRGTFAEMLRARGLEIDCVEPDPENQGLLREIGFPVQATINEQEIESIDYIYTLNVLEHVPEDKELVRAIFSRLRRGGRLFVFVPAFPLLWSRLDDHVQHQRRYRRGPLVAMLCQAGFVVVRSRYADCLGFFAALLFGHSGTPKISPRSLWIYDRLLFPVSRFLDLVLGGRFGKNVLAVCRKP